MKTTTITTAAGRTFNAILIEKGDRYGLDDCLTHTKAEPMVEFWDASCANRPGQGAWDPGFGPKGQFASRYTASTLAGHRGALSLDYGIPAWTIDAQALDAALVAVGVRSGSRSGSWSG